MAKEPSKIKDELATLDDDEGEDLGFAATQAMDALDLSELNLGSQGAVEDYEDDTIEYGAELPIDSDDAAAMLQRLRDSERDPAATIPEDAAFPASFDPTDADSVDLDPRRTVVESTADVAEVIAKAQSLVSEARVSQEGDPAVRASQPIAPTVSEQAIPSEPELEPSPPAPSPPAPSPPEASATGLMVAIVLVAILIIAGVIFVFIAAST